MHKPTVLVVSVTLAVAATTGLLARYAPLTTVAQTAVALQHATDTLVLNPGQSFQQKFQAEAGWHSGVILYSSAPFLDDRKLLVRILDVHGHERARGSTTRSSYSRQDGDTLRLQMSTTWFKTTSQEKMLADFTLLSGPSLPLKVITKVSGRRDSALRILQPTTLSSGAQQGVLAGLIVMLNALVLALWIPHQWQWRAAGGLLVVGAILGVAGFWFSPDRLGIADWDYYFSLHNSYRQTILEYHQLPFWNPYICGGTSGIGDPEFPLFTLTFLLELIFGIPTGLRLAIYFSVITGGLGMLTMAHRLKISVWGGLIAALVYMFSTANLLEIVEGHVNIFAAMWLPWLWWSWIGAYQHPNRWRVLLVGLCFALLFMQAGIYLLIYTLLTLTLVIMLVPHKRRAVIITAGAGVWAVGLVAIKLVPVLFWLHQFPQQTYATSTFFLPWLSEILFGRHVTGSYIIFDQRSGWHEYGTYVGYLVVGLSLLGLTQVKKYRVIALLVIIGIGALLLATLGPVMESAYDFLWFIPRSNMSRLMILTISTLGLLAGFGLDALRQRLKSAVVPVLLVGFVAIDLLSLAYPASLQAFTLPPVYPMPTPPPAPIAYTVKTFDHQANDLHQTRSYEATKVGWGTLFHCSVLGPKPAIVPVESDDDSRLLATTAGVATASIIQWSPNKLTAQVAAQTSATITLNTNYAAGWLINGQPTTIVNDRPAVTVSPGLSTLEFTYHAPGFRLGLAVTVLTFIATTYLALKSKPTRENIH